MIFDRLAAGFRPYLLLALLTLIVALPGIASIPPLDRDEARFAVASREMIETEDFVTARFQDEIRAKKPPLINWLQAESAEALEAEDDIWAYRVPSAVGALIAVLATFHFGAVLVGRKAALLGAALLAITPLVASEAHQAKTDALLLACIVVAQGALARFYMAARGGDGLTTPAPGWGTVLAFWLAQAAGILTKGPIAPMVSALTIAALVIADRRTPRGWVWLKGLRALPGIVLMVVLVAPWAIAVSLATSGQFLAQAVGHDLMDKVTSGQESHAAPPGTFLLLASATLWPAATFMLPGLVAGIRRRAQPAMRFCLAWAIPSWIVFELVPTKLPHYVLPCIPALALLAGAALVDAGPIWQRLWLRLYAIVGALIGVVVAVAFVLANAPFLMGLGLASAAITGLGAAASLTAGIGVAVLLLRGRPLRAATAAIVASALVLAALFGGVLPRLTALFPAQELARLVPPGAPVAVSGYHEPSLVFLLGTHTKLTDGGGAAAFLLDTPGAVVAVDQRDEADFLARVRAGGRSPDALGEVTGMNLARGRPVDLMVWTLDAKP